jgi:hypothetical protein
MNLWHWLHRRRSATSRFELGQIVVTQAARDALRGAGVAAGDLLGRHAFGDWGQVDVLDRKQNELGLRLGLRLRSVYTIEATEKEGAPADRLGSHAMAPSIHTTLWVITTPSRARTTILLPSEIFDDESTDDTQR